jgi:GT2 family glycosyltransferase
MLTIITITKNDIQGILRTIQSTRLLRQSYNVKQLIIDSSDQQTYQNLIDETENEINLTLLHQSAEGIAKAFNYGIKIAPDGWLWFLNGGDEVHTELDHELFIKILQKTQADIIIFEIQYDTGEITKHPCLADLWPPVFNWIPHPATLIKRSALLSVNGFREDFTIAMDGDLWFRLLKNPVTTDLISFPIAKFYKGGLSSDESKTAKEVTRLLSSHLIVNLKIWLYEGKRIFDSLIYYSKQ